MIYVSLLLLSVLFIELFILFGINNSVRSVLRVSREAYAVIMASELNDNEKELFLRRSSLDMLGITLIFLAKIAAIVLALFILFLLLSSAFSLSGDRLIEVSLLPQTMIALIVLGVLYIRLRSVIIRRLQSC